jgi:hypothetical protein
MTHLPRRALLLVFAAAAPAWGQFELYLVNGNIEQPVARVYDFGSVEPGSSSSVPFRIRNTSTAPATLDFLTVSGAGFSLASSNALSLPVSLAPQQAVDFAVIFQSNGTGLYSAALDAVAISVILSATVPVELTCQLATSSGTVPLAAAPVDFGSVARGSLATQTVVMLNQTTVSLIAPAPVPAGVGFTLGGPSPGGTLVAPAGSVSFIVQFAPQADGTAAGLLTVGGRTYALTGTGVEPPLPKPKISVALAQPGSAQQGTVTVNLDAPSETSGTGTVTLSFVSALPLGAATDPGIQFASSGQSAAFTVSPGDTQGNFGTAVTAPFQTGTTEGVLTVTAQLGGVSDRQSIAILPAAVGLTAAQAVRSAGAIEVDLTGYDNTRTAGPLAFTFYDASGRVIGPGAIAADGTATFAAYFQTSAGGTFTLTAIFPVTGATSQVTAFQAMMTNSAGSTTTARTNF